MRQSSHDIRPIGQAIRDAERELSDAEWTGDEQAITRASTVLASLKSQAAHGEEYAVPF
ncbi:hypothetical protein [Ancylobacter polymorphus]|uniref:Uncharacterized protein n=1 Tax=Ancylobacter polymorphus TaxID=223390 RepID=A0ABU0BDC2_9HYPH|nr:hypothetical protein [Ancylobacter polymorphus]MDQ0303837.1 hypothetical protein [Ancylobacter polymorphus]